MSPKRRRDPDPDLPLVRVERSIFLIRGERVILDADLAELYGVPTRRLNEQVKRNADRFPEDFAFRLTRKELDELEVKTVDSSPSLRSQFATSKKGRGGRRYAPYAFSEHGAIMAANVLNSKRAVRMSVFVVRAFVRLRGFLAAHAELAGKLRDLERKVGRHDEAIRSLFTAIKQLMESSDPPSYRIGFHNDKG